MYSSSFVKCQEVKSFNLKFECWESGLIICSWILFYFFIYGTTFRRYTPNATVRLSHTSCTASGWDVTCLARHMSPSCWARTHTGAHTQWDLKSFHKKSLCFKVSLSLVFPTRAPFGSLYKLQKSEENKSSSDFLSGFVCYWVLRFIYAFQGHDERKSESEGEK